MKCKKIISIFDAEKEKLYKVKTFDHEIVNFKIIQNLIIILFENFIEVHSFEIKDKIFYNMFKNEATFKTENEKKIKGKYDSSYNSLFSLH